MVWFRIREPIAFSKYLDFASDFWRTLQLPIGFSEVHGALQTKRWQMGTGTSLSKLLVSALHRFYKVLLSPFFGNACRFYPSCSDYAREAVEQHGWLKGAALACKRVCRCHPWHPGGDDPVPRK